MDRRSFLAPGIAAMALLCLPRVVFAQDARESLVQAAARAWLKSTDALNGPASWDAAGQKLKKGVTKAEWARTIEQHRAPLGAVQQRTAIRTQFSRQFQGVPEGDYAIATYRTAFAKKTEAFETVTLEREADGQWRVIGYSYR